LTRIKAARCEGFRLFAMVLSLHPYNATGRFRADPAEGIGVRAFLAGLVALNIAGLVALVMISVAR